MRHLPAALLAVSLSACSLAWQAADQAGRYSAKRVEVSDIAVAGGGRVVRVVNGLNYPSAFTWDAAGNLYILESHTVPVPLLKAKIVRVGTDGRISRVRLDGVEMPTAIGLTFHDGWLYFSHELKDGTFGISRVRPEGGAVEAVVRNVPTQGDHDINHLVFDAQGNLYFGAGSATNSSVVSADDPVNQKWLKQHPDAHDIPCRDVTLTPRGSSLGAYQALGRTGATKVASAPLCTSALYRLRPGSATPELVAWGFRNPVALAFDRDGTLYVGMQGADMRSARPVSGDADSVLRIRDGAWYGWPDYNAKMQPMTPEPVLDLSASALSAPDPSLLVATTKPHAAISGMSLAPDGRFLLAEMGDFKPMTEKNDLSRAGFQIESVDPHAGGLATWARNRGTGDPQPASMLDLRNGFERPVDVRVRPDGLIYVLDFGAFVVTDGKPKAMPKTGKLFVITPSAR